MFPLEDCTLRVLTKVILVSRCSWTLYCFRSGLIRELKKENFRVIGAGAGGDGYEKKIEELGIPFRSIPVDRKSLSPLADLRLLFHLYFFYRTEKPDVVHHFTIKPVIYGSIAAHLAGVPRIVNTIPGLGYVYTGDKGWLRKIVDSLYRIALSCADVVMFQNEDDRRLFTESGIVNPQKTELVPGSGVSVDHFSPYSTVDHEADSFSNTTVLLVSRLLRDKGINEFVAAARLVKNALPGTRFQILGGIDERNPTAIPIQEVRDWQAEGVIEWLGHTDGVRPFLAKADIVVLPSYYREGVPRSLLEAAAMEKPVIATDSVGCRDAVEPNKTGLLVPAKDVSSLAEAIIILAKNPQLRREMGKAGRERVMRKFDERIVIAKSIAAYSEPR